MSAAERSTVSADVSELPDVIPQLRAGDRLLLSGGIYTARDAAHIRMFEMLDAGEELPFNLRDAVIYYVGPTPGNGQRPVGACGPTTSSRMDAFTPRLHDMGLLATIGKGDRSVAVWDAIVRNNAIYLCAVGGAGALVSKHIVDMEEIAFSELGCESIKRLTINSMPLTVAIDSMGGDIFRIGRQRYERSKM